MFEETLKLVQTSDDVSVLRQELEAVRRGLYKIDNSKLKIENSMSRLLERVLETEVRAVVAEAIRADLVESTKSTRGTESTEGRESTTSRASREGMESIKSIKSIEGTESMEGTYSRTQVEGFLDALEEELARLKSIRLTLAFEPTRDMILRLTTFFKREARTQVVLELRVDPTILGGLQLTTFEGRFWDLSVAGKLEGILTASREEILGRLKRGLKQENKLT